MKKKIWVRGLGVSVFALGMLLFQSSCTILSTAAENAPKHGFDELPVPWEPKTTGPPPIPVSADLVGVGKLNDVPAKKGSNVESDEPLVVAVAGEGGTAKNHTGGIAMAGQGGTAVNARYGIAYTPQGGNAQGGANSVAFTRGGRASTGDGGVSISKNYNGKAEVGRWGIAYAMVPGDRNYGQAKGGEGSVLVLAGFVQRDGERRWVVRTVQVGKQIDGLTIEPRVFYTLDSKGRVIKGE